MELKNGYPGLVVENVTPKEIFRIQKMFPDAMLSVRGLFHDTEGLPVHLECTWKQVRVYSSGSTHYLFDGVSGISIQPVLGYCNLWITGKDAQ